jgi:hypothetical protein
MRKVENGPSLVVQLVVGEWFCSRAEGRAHGREAAKCCTLSPSVLPHRPITNDGADRARFPLALRRRASSKSAGCSRTSKTKCVVNTQAMIRGNHGFICVTDSNLEFSQHARLCMLDHGKCFQQCLGAQFRVTFPPISLVFSFSLFRVAASLVRASAAAEPHRRSWIYPRGGDI